MLLFKDFGSRQISLVADSTPVAPARGRSSGGAHPVRSELGSVCRPVRLGRMVREYGPEPGHVSSFRRRTRLVTALGAHRPGADSARVSIAHLPAKGPNPAGLLSRFQGPSIPGKSSLAE